MDVKEYKEKIIKLIEDNEQLNAKLYAAVNANMAWARQTERVKTMNDQLFATKLQIDVYTDEIKKLEKNHKSELLNITNKTKALQITLTNAIDFFINFFQMGNAAEYPNLGEISKHKWLCPECHHMVPCMEINNHIIICLNISDVPE